MKTCTKCGESKVLNAFTLTNGRPYAHCKACKAATQQARRDGWRPERRRFDRELPLSASKPCAICGVAIVRHVGEYASEFKERQTCNADCAKALAWQRRRVPIVDGLRRCLTCDRDRPIADFPINSRGNPAQRCRDCQNDRVQRRRAAQTAYQRDHLTEMQTCPKCGAAKPLSDFSVTAYRCRDCDSALRPRHPEKAVARAKRWMKANPDKVIEYQQRRRARKHGASHVATISRRAVIERDQSTCYLCSKSLKPGQITLDHIVPLAKGGTHTEDNLRVACRSCNCRKSITPLDTYLARRS